MSSELNYDLFSFILYLRDDVLLFMEGLCLRASVSVCKRLLLYWLSGQVGNERSDGADVRDDPEHDGEHGEPQSLARGGVGALKIPLSRSLVGLLRKIEGRDAQRPEAAEHGEKRQAQVVLRDHQRKVAVTVRITEIIDRRVVGVRKKVVLVLHAVGGAVEVLRLGQQLPLQRRAGPNVHKGGLQVVLAEKVRLAPQGARRVEGLQGAR